MKKVINEQKNKIKRNKNENKTKKKERFLKLRQYSALS